MNSLKNISVIIPSLDPDKRLSDVVNKVIEAGFCDIILIDDGSHEENKKHFPKGDKITLLTHPKNLGKGAGIKTGLNYVIENRTDTLGVVTCDGDGQHLAADVRAVCEKMIETEKFVLGVRDFSLPNVPPKSRIGNRMSTLLLALCCGSVIHDTQTGLRAIPKKLLKPMTEIEGNRFEYETNVLLALRSLGARFCEVKIETVYLDENKGTHFHPIKDTFRIFGRIIKYAVSSTASFLTDIILFCILNSFTAFGVIVSTVIARIASSLVNFILNKKMVFRSGEPLAKTILKYYALAIPVMLISAFGVKGIAMLLSLDSTSIWTTFIKIAVDCILFILNYKIQKTWIFKSK